MAELWLLVLWLRLASKRGGSINGCGIDRGFEFRELRLRAVGLILLIGSDWISVMRFVGHSERALVKLTKSLDGTSLK